MDCLPILGMVSGCATPDLAMLRWIAYVKSLNPEIRHISGKDNAMADMLSRARYDDENGMVSEDEEVGVDFFETARVMTGRASTPTLNEFDESEYDGEWLLIRRFLRTMTLAAEWTREEANWIRMIGKVGKYEVPELRHFVDYKMPCDTEVPCDTKSREVVRRYV
jgi:hypothetical protein